MKPAAARRWAIGIDVGGAFIDVIACASDGSLRAQFELHQGDRLSIETAGGGGWGTPGETRAGARQEQALE